MPDNYCFLCASDEGVFLDVTPDNQSTFGDQLETCLITKINENIELSNKVCYKCAYELDHCTKFVKKYKDSREIAISKAQTAVSSCCLCLELTDKNRIFDITKDNRAIFNPLQKIRNIFNEDLTKKDVSSKLICLTCRYNLDVLYDLKKIYQETVTNLKALINKEIDYSSFPKVHTDVVNRKTTITTFPDITLYASLSSDSEGSENMSRAKSRVKNRNRGKSVQKSRKKVAKTIKVRTCDECHNVVENGSDMYRFHRTGLTVCKTCWITMDPNRSKGKRRLRNNAETKLCTVFLTDVLSEGSHKNEKSYKIEKDEDGNKLYVISDDSSEDVYTSESSRLSVSPKSQNHTTIDSSPKKRGQKRRIDTKKSDIENTPSKMTRSSTQAQSTRATKPTTKESSNTLSPVTRQMRKKTSTGSSDSDISQPTSKKLRAHTSNNRAKRDASPASPASLPVESVKKSNRKRLRSDGATRSEHSDSSNEGSQSRKKRNPAITWVAPTTKPDVEIKRETRSRTRSSSISSTDMPLIGFKSPKSVEIKASSESVKTEYTCDKCNKKFDNKILSAEHRLTHLKQITLKLERVDVNNEEKQETKAEEGSQEKKTPEAETKAHSSRTVFSEKHGDEASEEIAINVEDDTDDEDMYNLLKNKTEEEPKVMAKHDESEESEKTEKTTDKLDTAEDESQRTEEESTKTRDDKDDVVVTEESEQREESTTTALSDKPEISNEIEEKDTEDKDEKEKNEKDQDEKDQDEKDQDEKDQDTKTPVNEIVDISQDEEAEEEVKKKVVVSAEDDQNTEEKRKEGGEKIQPEDDAKVLTEEKKEQSESINECNNDAEKNVQEATTQDNETLSVSDSQDAKSIDNNDATKDRDENCANESANICQNNKDEKTEDVVDEITQDNSLTNESQKENNDEKDKEKSAKEEKEIKITLDITNNKTKLSSDEKHLDDVMVVDEIGVTTESEQNGDDLMAEIIMDKPNGLEDIAKSDLLNCEKLDRTVDGLEDDDDDDVVMVPLVNNNDVEKAKKLTEEALLRDDDDSKENYRLEDGIKSLERLIKETVVNEEYENVQENSNHASTDDSPANAASEILSEVFDLAAAEVQKREDKTTKNLDDTEIETLENISREIRNSADMPSLDPISVMELDDDDDDGITLN